MTATTILAPAFNASWLASQNERAQSEFLASLSDDEAKALAFDWLFWARANQIAPVGEWDVWLVLAGRGFGKTRTGAEWVRQIKETCSRIALVAPTAADARDVMVEGESGILAISPPWDRPVYEPSKRRVTWKNGSVATLFSAEEPERLRGPQHDAAWCDEAAAWKYAETMDQLDFGLRLGTAPRKVITTTPKPIKLIRDILAEPGTVTTRGSTYENRANLAEKFIKRVVSKYEGTRLGRQELNAEILDDVPGALWTRAMLDANRIKALKDVPELSRIVVSIDPSGTAGGDDQADDIGIVVAGKGVDGRAYVLADRTCHLSPAGWGKRAIEAYHEFNADRVIAERNFGGAMVEHVIRSVDGKIPFRLVTASKGKIARAEPVAALYEQGLVSHVGSLGSLEDQMCHFTTTGYVGGGSPDRADALVWALTELMLGSSVEWEVF